MNLAKVTSELNSHLRSRGAREGTTIVLGAGAQACFGLDGRPTLHLATTVGGVRASYRPLSRGALRSIEIADDAQLGGVITELADVVLGWAQRLSTHELRPRSCFRAIRPLLGYAVGDVLEVTGDLYAPHDAGALWCFRRISDGRAATLTELADDHLPILRDLDGYLEPASPATTPGPTG